MTTSANHPMAWADQGACRGMDTDLFYPGRGETLDRTVVAACNRCPVRTACHDWALHHETDGIWAGTDPHGRRRIRRALGIEVADTPDPIDPPQDLAS